MMPQERQLVSDLFDRLATLERERRDIEAERAIAEGLLRAPNAPYALVQTVLVQDEALKRANERIRELESALGGDARPGQGGFLDSMRETLFGREDRRGSVPSVRPTDAPMGVPPGFPTGAASNAPHGPTPMEPSEPRGRGGSFLGTAAAAAAGVVGGALLLDGIRSMLGHAPSAQAQSALDSQARSPGGSESAGGDLAREAGLGDMGRSVGNEERGADRHAGLFDSASDGEESAAEFADDDFDADFSGDIDIP